MPIRREVGKIKSTFRVGGVDVEVEGRASAYFKSELTGCEIGAVSAPNIRVVEAERVKAPFFELFSMREGRRYVHVPLRDLDSGEITITYERGVSPAFVFYVFEPILHLFLLRKGLALVHGAAFARNGRGILLSSWGGTGKTTTVLWMAMKGGYTVLSDDWSLVSRKGALLRYPKRIRVYGYNLKEYPELSKISGPLFMHWYRVYRWLYENMPLRWGRIVLSKFEPRIPLRPEKISPAAAGIEAVPLELALLMKKKPGATDVSVENIKPEDYACAVVYTVRFERDYFFRKYYEYAYHACSVRAVEEHDNRLYSIVLGALQKVGQTFLVHVPPRFTRREAARLESTVQTLLS